MQSICHEIRPARPEDAPGIARVHVDTWRTTYAGIVPHDYLQQLDYQRRETMWRSVISKPAAREHLFIAESGGRVIGFTSGGPLRDALDPSAGEIYAIYLLQDFQGRGIGRELFSRSFVSLRRDGFESALLWALEENPTCRFYRLMGGKECGEKTETIGGRELKEISFIWSPLPSAD